MPHIFQFVYTGAPAGKNATGPAALYDPYHPKRRFGYIRINSFDADPDEFFREFKRILLIMKVSGPDGLILDLRANPGGAIDAGERILQLLTPKRITPADFHFINTPMLQQIAARLTRESPAEDAPLRSVLRPWMQDILDSVAGGDVLTNGRPLTSAEEANDTGQQYQGPVALLIDALSYSATDIFAGGFQDHGIGIIAGADLNTGGGGANRWSHDELVTNLAVIPGLPLAELKTTPVCPWLSAALRVWVRAPVGRWRTLE